MQELAATDWKMPRMMKLRHLIVCISLLLLAGSVSAQLDFRHKKSSPVFPRDLKHKGVGYFGGFGGTWSTTLLTPERVTVVSNDVDTFWTIDVSAAGRVGFYLEGGRYHLLEYSKAWRYIDYGMSYHTLRGRETWNENLLISPGIEPVTLASGQTTWSNHYLSAFFNANNVKEYSGKRILQNTLGARLGYNFRTWNEQLKVATIQDNEQIKGKILAQLHYKLGFGFKVKGRALLIPSVELPFFNLWPFDFKMGGVGVWNARYNPVLFHLRILPFSHRFKRYFR